MEYEKLRLMRFLLILIFPFTLNAQGFKNMYSYINEFVTVPTEVIASGANASNTNTASNDHSTFGLLQSSTGTTSGGIAGVATSVNAVRLGGSVWMIDIMIDSIGVLCDGTESYSILAGMFDNTSGVDQVDGIYFLYDSIGVSTGSASSDKWQVVTDSASTRTFFTTSSTVSTSGHHLRIMLNQDASSVDFIIDNNAARTATVTIPKNRHLGFGVLIIKSAGSTARTVYTDYLSVEANYVTPKR
jgi:hypothetical protein